MNRRGELAIAFAASGLIAHDSGLFSILTAVLAFFLLELLAVYSLELVLILSAAQMAKLTQRYRVHYRRRRMRLVS